MSRTKKGSKGPGCDLWSRRPYGGHPNNALYRKFTTRKERAQELQKLHRTKKRYGISETPQFRCKDFL